MRFGECNLNKQEVTNHAKHSKGTYIHQKTNEVSLKKLDFYDLVASFVLRPL